MDAETQTASATSVETATQSAESTSVETATQSTESASVEIATQTEGAKCKDARVGTIQPGSGEPYTYCVQLSVDEYEKQKLMGSGGTIEALTQQMFAVAEDTDMDFCAKKKWLMKLKEKYPFIWKENNGDELMCRLQNENKGCSIV